YTYASVYHDYVRAYKDKHGNNTRVMSETTFIRIWKALIPSLQFMSPKSDLCELCETMKMEIQHATQHEKKVELTENYIAHLNRAQKERDYYNNNITNAIEDSKRNPNLTKSLISFKTFDGCAHITYDWAQNLQIPYSPQQIGSLFFKSSRKAHLFGVCNTGNYPNTQQINYIIDEAEMPDDGKQGKGVNCTLSLVWHAIQKYNRGEKKLIVTCDNCVGQNKNNYSLFFYSWLIDRGMYEEVELNFMIPGHTKFICDGCFGLIKILYRKSKVNTVDDIVSIVNRSTTNNFNVAQRYLDGE
ncbi:11679_t:CDS:1, partial [Ambispora leptoticha]